MAKVIIKSEKIIPFGGIFHVREFFPITLAPLSTKYWVSDDKTLGQEFVSVRLLFDIPPNHKS